MTRSIVIAGGGTGGHVYPGLAVADAIRAIEPDASVTFVGTARGLEASAVPAAGFALDTIDVIPWARTLGLRRFVSPATAVRAAAQARAVLRRRRARAVLAMGGYASLPAAIAAFAARIPLIVHEQNAIPGRANRVAARLTRRVAVTFAESARFFPHPGEVRVTGNPIRPALANPDRNALRPQALAEFGLADSPPVVLFAGGSRGAARLSDAARALAARTEQDTSVQILLIAGRGRTQPSRPNLREIEFTDRMDLAYAAADVVVSRSGAGIAEVAAAGLPAILVPYPYARDDHQTANARVFEAAGAALVIADADATPERLGALIAAIAGDADRRRAMSGAARTLARPDAASDVARMVLDAAGAAR